MSNASLKNTTLCCSQHVACLLLVERAYPKPIWATKNSTIGSLINTVHTKQCRSADI
jgi:hypothetical protein